MCEVINYEKILYSKLCRKKTYWFIYSCINRCIGTTMISPDSYTKTFVTLVLVALSLIACFANDRLKNTTKSVFYKNIGIVYAAIFGVIFSQFFVDNVSIKYIVLIFCIILYFVLYKKSKDLN